MLKKRSIVQLGSLIALNLGALLQLKWLCPQLFHCHACPASVVACPIGVIGYYISLGIVPVFALGVILIIAAAIGRFLCGWVCPFGLLQDLLYKIPIKKVALPAWARWIKYGVLIGMVFLVAGFIGQDSMLYFCKICPSATLTAIVPGAIQTGTIDRATPTVVRMAVLVAVILFSMIVSRGFCRALCPVGALVAPFNEAATVAVTIEHDTCIDCGACRRACPMGVDPMKLAGAPDTTFETRSECISCTDCTKVCPKDCLSLGL